MSVAAGLVVVAAGGPGVAPRVGGADGEADRRLLGWPARGERAEVDERDVQERPAGVHPHGVGVVGPAGAGQDHAVVAAAPSVGADDLSGSEMRGPLRDEPCCRCLRGDRPPTGDAGVPVGQPRRRGQRRERCGRQHRKGHFGEGRLRQDRDLEGSEVRCVAAHPRSDVHGATSRCSSSAPGSQPWWAPTCRALSSSARSGSLGGGTGEGDHGSTLTARLRISEMQRVTSGDAACVTSSAANRSARHAAPGWPRPLDRSVPSPILPARPPRINRARGDRAGAGGGGACPLVRLTGAASELSGPPAGSSTAPARSVSPMCLDAPIGSAGGTGKNHGPRLERR